MNGHAELLKLARKIQIEKPFGCHAFIGPDGEVRMSFGLPRKLEKDTSKNERLNDES